MARQPKGLSTYGNQPHPCAPALGSEEWQAAQARPLPAWRGYDPPLDPSAQAAIDARREVLDEEGELIGPQGNWISRPNGPAREDLDPEDEVVEESVGTSDHFSSSNRFVSIPDMVAEQLHDTHERAIAEFLDRVSAQS